jgi:hypothetical protein
MGGNAEHVGGSGVIGVGFGGERRNERCVWGWAFKGVGRVEGGADWVGEGLGWE